MFDPGTSKTATMASTSKYLAQSNKSLETRPATRRGEAPRDAAQFRALAKSASGSGWRWTRSMAAKTNFWRKVTSLWPRGKATKEAKVWHWPHQEVGQDHCMSWLAI